MDHFFLRSCSPYQQVFFLCLSIIPSLFSPTKYNWSGGVARKCECGGEEPSCPELWGFWHPPPRDHLVEGWSANQSLQLSTRPLRWDRSVYACCEKTHKTTKTSSFSLVFLYSKLTNNQLNIRSYNIGWRFKKEQFSKPPIMWILVSIFKGVTGTIRFPSWALKAKQLQYITSNSL